MTSGSTRNCLILTRADPRSDHLAETGPLEAGDQATDAAGRAIIGEQSGQRLQQAGVVEQRAHEARQAVVLTTVGRRLAAQDRAQDGIEQTHAVGLLAKMPGGYARRSPRSVPECVFAHGV